MYNCNKHGHILYNYPHEDKRKQGNRKGYNMAQLCLTFTQKENSQDAMINENWVLLDICSTVGVCCKASILTDIRTCNKNETLTIITTGGSQNYDKIEYFKYLPILVYYNKDSLANILLFKEVALVLGICITMDTSMERAIFVTLPDGRKMKFKECDIGLYYFDVNDDLE